MKRWFSFLPSLGQLERALGPCRSRRVSLTMTLGSRSHCPHSQQEARWRDNLPTGSGPVTQWRSWGSGVCRVGHTGATVGSPWQPLAPAPFGALASPEERCFLPPALLLEPAGRRRWGTPPRPP